MKPLNFADSHYFNHALISGIMVLFQMTCSGYAHEAQTKVVDHGLGPLKVGPTRLCVLVCNHDAASSKPSSVGRDVVDIHQQTKCDCVVNVCGSNL